MHQVGGVVGYFLWTGSGPFWSPPGLSLSGFSIVSLAQILTKKSPLIRRAMGQDFRL